MKLQPDQFDVQSINACGPDWVSVNGEKFTTSLLVGSRGELTPWPVAAFADLDAEHFATLSEMAPELVIFGSGQKLRFPSPAWLSVLMARRIGVETMDTQAACRTYNILAGEGRHVIAALLVEPVP
ncbi:Mth938-like domain-containing protein [Variovorax sp. VNK109]|uniref:Mth938-like domain-containing protein n=1 Tax=Variovorax sp. VNK109 TaxID=3400919 RepID=UPI003C07939E